jgi:hypothetical protein
MRTQDSVWQGHFGYWQNLFIRQNLLAIGYTAWNGFLTAGQGMVVCEVDLSSGLSVDWNIDIVPYTLQFVPQSQTAADLQKLELEPTIISELLQMLAVYDPTQEIFILLTGNGQIDINLLRHLALSPAECYEQVHQRWDEFQPCLLAPKYR